MRLLYCINMCNTFIFIYYTNTTTILISLLYLYQYVSSFIFSYYADEYYILYGLRILDVMYYHNVNH